MNTEPAYTSTCIEPVPFLRRLRDISLRFTFLVAIAAVSTAGWSGIPAQTSLIASKLAEVATGSTENGKQLFTKYGCYECHGRQAQGGGYNGPRLAPDPVPFSVLLSYVRHPEGEMPPYTVKVLSDQELADIYAFLQSVPRPPSAKTLTVLK